MCDRLALMEMTDAEKAAVIAEYAHLDRMLADRRSDAQARAERFGHATSPPVTASPSRDALTHLPLDHAGAGNSISEQIA